MSKSHKFYVPSMHGPWYPGTWHEEVTEEKDGVKSVSLYRLYAGGRALLFSIQM